MDRVTNNIMKVTFVIQVFIHLLLIASPLLLLGQPSSPSNVPIDGGASILAAAGLAYGIKKYRDYRKEEGRE